LVKSSALIQASGKSSLTMRAVTGSASMPVSTVLAAAASGSMAMNRPVPQPGSSTRPPVKPMRVSARQIARTMNSGV
jgi:hypothetical protein